MLDRIRSSPLSNALSAQLIGLCFSILFLWIVPEISGIPLAAALIQGAAAAIASHHLGARAWWQAIHLCFVPCALLASQLSVPSWLWLAGFVLLLLVFGRTDRTQVPLYLTNRTTGLAVAQQLPKGPGFAIDLGCGDGGVIAQLAKARPDCEFIGIEHAWLTWLLARIRCHPLSNVHVRRGDFWKQPLTPYDVVYAFLSPAPMASLWSKACTEMRPGTLLISNSFPIPDIAPDEIIEVADRRCSRLFIYRIPDLESEPTVTI